MHPRASEAPQKGPAAGPRSLKAEDPASCPKFQLPCTGTDCPPKQQGSPMPQARPHLTERRLFACPSLRPGTQSSPDPEVGAGACASLDQTSSKRFSHNFLMTLIVTTGYRSLILSLYKWQLWVCRVRPAAPRGTCASPGTSTNSRARSNTAPHQGWFGFGGIWST